MFSTTARAGFAACLLLAVSGFPVKAQDTEAVPTPGPQQVIGWIAKTYQANPALKIAPPELLDEGFSRDNAALLAGIGVYFDLHASELKMRGLYERHASAYVRWNRARNNRKLGLISPVEEADKLSWVEETRLAYFRERSRNTLLRAELEELTGQTLPEELTGAPQPPAKKPLQLNAGELLGSRASDVVLKRRVRGALLYLSDSWQQIIAARAKLDFLQKNLMRQQQLYQQERTVGLGSAMIDVSFGESELTKAVGAYYRQAVKLSMLIGGPDAGLGAGVKLALGGLDKDFLYKLSGQKPGADGQYVPKSGSGFGQKDQ